MYRVLSKPLAVAALLSVSFVSTLAQAGTEYGTDQQVRDLISDFTGLARVLISLECGRLP